MFQAPHMTQGMNPGMIPGMNSMMPPNRTTILPSGAATLFIGDLDEQITEEMLY